MERVERKAKGRQGQRGQATAALAAIAHQLVAVMPSMATPATPRPSIILTKAIPRMDRPSANSQARAAGIPSGKTAVPDPTGAGATRATGAT